MKDKRDWIALVSCLVPVAFCLVAFHFTRYPKAMGWLIGAIVSVIVGIGYYLYPKRGE